MLMKTSRSSPGVLLPQAHGGEHPRAHHAAPLDGEKSTDLKSGGSGVNPPRRSSRRKTRSSAHRRKKRFSFSSLLGRGKGWGQFRLLAMLTLVCAGAALLFSVFMQTDMQTMVKVILFRSTDPYISPNRQKEIQNEFRELVEKEIGGDLRKNLRRLR